MLAVTFGEPLIRDGYLVFTVDALQRLVVELPISVAKDICGKPCIGLVQCRNK